MPAETMQAVMWAISEKDNYSSIVDKVREYFNNNGVEYNTFSYDDLVPYLEKAQE